MNLSLEEQIEVVRDLTPDRQAPDDRALATWWVQATKGTTYYRCSMPAEQLPGQALSLRWDDLDPFMERQRGASIWQFPGNATRGIFMSELKEQGVKVLVEVDDLYTVPAPQIPGYRSSEWGWKVDPKGLDDHTREAHIKLVRFADGVICSTPRLAEKYRHLNPNVYVCPNSVQPRDWKGFKKPDDGILRIGYAYSTSHYHDFKLIAPALEWAAAQPDVEVVMIGERWASMTWFDRVPHKHIAWMESLEQYRETLHLLDIGLSPLRENTWSACKSDVKALEYAMAGALPVVQRAEPYRPWFDWEYVCETEKDWTRMVKHLVQHRDIVRDEAETARRWVLDTRTIEKAIHHWEEAIS